MPSPKGERGRPALPIRCIGERKGCVLPSVAVVGGAPAWRECQPENGRNDFGAWLVAGDRAAGIDGPKGPQQGPHTPRN